MATSSDLPTDGAPRLRVAPSPTGDPHVGTAYMAMFDLAFARQQGGSFLLRIEDTDRARFDATSEQQLYDTLHWLGLTWDEGPDIGGPCSPYRQSERLDTYRPYVERLLADGHAYHCWCSAERLTQMREEQQRQKLPTGYDRLCLGKTEEERAALPGFSPDPVVRMRIPDDPADLELSWDDLIMGRTSAPHPDDQVVLKADGFPTYHLAVVVDDHEMGITHVVRGQEWISSTPKHLLLYRWLGLEPPRFAHMPLLRDEKRAKISKRKNPWARLTWFQERGYLPEALVNFLALQGYPPIVEPDGSEREVFTFAEFTERFRWDDVNVAGSIFNLDKLDWLNGIYLRALSPADLAERLLPHLVADEVLSDPPSEADRATLVQLAELVGTRIVVLADAAPLIRPFFVADGDLEIADDARAQLGEEAGGVLEAAYTALKALSSRGEWNAAAIEATLREALVEGLGIKARLAFGPLRTAVSGQRISPPLFESMEILGPDSTLARLTNLRATL
ncbi:MAG: glutamate--tRNA ligase [Nocardioides sp.]